MDRLKELVAVNRAIVGTLEYGELLRLLVDRTGELTGAEACALVLVGDDGLARIAAHDGLAGDCAARFEAAFDERIGHLLCARLGWSEDAYMGVPVIARDRIRGLLLVFWSDRRAEPLEADEFILTALADQAGIALLNARRFEEERARREHHARWLEAIQANTSTHLAYLSPDLRFLEVNEAYCMAVGERREALVGVSYRDVFPGSPRVAALERVVETGAAHEEPEQLRDLAMGKAVWNWRVRPVYRPDFTVEGLVISAVDITDRVANRQALEAQNERKDEFLAMLAHELRNPLASIHAGLEVLRLRGPKDEATGRVVEAAGRQAEHMKRLLDDLLDVARITRGKIELKQEVLPLASVVKQALQACEPLMQTRGHDLRVEVETAPIHVLGDRDRLVQVVSNILSNAAKYTDPGGSVQVDLRRKGSQAILHVTDDGSGIPPDVLPHVFDLFVQSKRGLDREQGGLGLGLTLVKRLVDMHGGDVRADSGERGTTVEVRLPIAEGEAATAEPAPPEVAATAGRRILLVEDDPDAADMLKTLLEIKGHAVEVARHGEAALTSVRRSPPDLILLDIGLPGMDGFEVARRLRALGFERRIAALSGYGQAEDRQRAKDAGIDVHLVKPVDMDRLQTLLSEP